MISKIKKNIWSESFNCIILQVQINSKIEFFKITLENKFFIKEISLSMQCEKKREFQMKFNAGDELFKKLWNRIFHISEFSRNISFNPFSISLHFHSLYLLKVNILYQDFSTFVHWIKKFSRIDACESKVEIVTPYWASNSAGKIRAIVNTQHFEQAIHQEVCS